jgi:hypothetical protein
LVGFPLILFDVLCCSFWRRDTLQSADCDERPKLIQFVVAGVADVADLSSFDKVQDWVNELQTNVFDDILICIVGNQIDKKYRKVDQKMAEDFAADIGALYFETSAKANIGIERMFLTISQEICRTLPENVVGPGSETGSQPFSLRASLSASRDGGQPGASQDSGCCLTS